MNYLSVICITRCRIIVPPYLDLRWSNSGQHSCFIKQGDRGRYSLTAAVPNTELHSIAQSYLQALPVAHMAQVWIGILQEFFSVSWGLL